MNFCSNCGFKVVLKIPPDDNRERYVCEACHTIHYDNPRNVIGSIPVWENKILLCKRAIEPRKGYWTLPAGFMENGETTEEAAVRETIEESGAHIDLQDLFSVMNVPHVHQVHLFYRAQMQSPKFAAGIESLEVALFDEADIPWNEIAFPTVYYTLKFFLADRARQTFTLHAMKIDRPMRRG